MHTAPRKFKLFVTPGSLRWNRWPGQLIPALDPFSMDPGGVLFTDPFNKVAGDFVAGRDVALWPSSTYSQGTNGVNFDGAGNVQGLYIAGLPIVISSTPQLGWNPDKRYRLTLKNTLFGNFRNGAFLLSMGWTTEFQAGTASLTVGRTLDTTNLTGQVTLTVNNVLTDTYNDPLTVLGQAKDLVMDVSAWNGTNRTIVVSLGGVKVITRTTNFRWVGAGANKGIRMSLQTGNDTTPGTVNIQTGKITLNGHA